MQPIHASYPWISGAIDRALIIEREEIKLILDFLSDQYISYENMPLIKLVREMREWYDNQL